MTTAEILFQYTVDRASADRAAREVARLFEDTRKRALGVDAAAEEMNKRLADIGRNKAIENIVTNARNAAIETGSWSDALEYAAYNLSAIGASEKEIQRVTDQIAKSAQETNILLERYRKVKEEMIATAEVAERSGGYGRSGNSRSGILGRIGTSIINSPDIGPSTDIGRALRGLDAVMMSTQASTTSLVASFGLLAPTMAGVALAVHNFNEQIKESKQLLDGAITAQDIYYDAVTTMSTAEVQADLEARQHRNAILQLQINETRQALESGWDYSIDAVNDSFGNLIRGLGLDSIFEPSLGQLADPLMRGLDALGVTPYQAMQEQLTELEGEFNINEQVIGRYTVGLQQNVFAINDARLAVEDLERAGAAYARSQFEASLQVQQMTSQERDARISEINYELYQMQRYSNAGIDLGQTTGEMAERAKQLEGELFVLQNTTESFADRAEATALRLEAITEANDNYLDGLEQWGKARDALTKAQQAYDKALLDSIQDQQKIREDAAEKEADITRKQADKLADLETNHGEKRADIIADYLNSIAEANEKFGVSQANAVGERDALAALRAEQQRIEEIKKAQKQADKQNADTDAQYKKQATQAQKQADEQMANARRQAERALQLETQRNNAELQTRQWALQQAQVDLLNAENAKRLLMDQIYINQQNAAALAGANIGNALINGAVRTATQRAWGPVTTQNSPNLNSFQPYVGINGQQVPANINVQVNTTRNASPTQVANQVRRELINTFGGPVATWD